MGDRPDFPTMAEVESADVEQLARWYRFLPTGDTKEQQKIMDRLAQRFREKGGMTAALSEDRLRRRLVFWGVDLFL
jgi:hypothetical protein